MSSPLLEHTSLCCGISLDSLQVMFRLFGGGCTIWPEARVASTCAAVTRQALPPFSGWMSANLTHVNHYGSFQSVPQLLRSLWTEAARTTSLSPSALLRRTPRCDGAPPHPSRADIPAPHSLHCQSFHLSPCRRNPWSGPSPASPCAAHWKGSRKC